MKIIGRISYIVLGMFFMLVFSFNYKKEIIAEKDATLSALNYLQGCFFVSTKLSQKYNIGNFNYWNFCVKHSNEIKNNYISISDQMDRLDP